ncbi:MULTISPECIES: hypothetical protein [unclassified Flavobacterium]|uniref:hypothetical protein n=1 Tax=unclassified Flavobacterium TaxID=196869 RepID=UPI001F1456AB|nr:MULTISPECIES: hypothetical protein [unclassified Flavobacterium]UMY64746.1 hypothetical protein MKO97_09495 [Flavobacterium sp. HJ-32-4]
MDERTGKPRFSALLQFLPEREVGGQSPISSGHRVGVSFPFSNLVWNAHLDFGDVENVYPGDSVSADMTLPDGAAIAGQLYVGLDFDFTQGDRVIGTGVVRKITV